MKKYIDWALIFISIIIVIILISNLYLNSQKKIIIQKKCFEYYENTDFIFSDTIAECKKY